MLLMERRGRSPEIISGGISQSVMPAEAGIHVLEDMGPSLRWGDFAGPLGQLDLYVYTCGQIELH